MARIQKTPLSEQQYREFMPVLRDVLEEVDQYGEFTTFQIRMLLNTGEYGERNIPGMENTTFKAGEINYGLDLLSRSEEELVEYVDEDKNILERQTMSRKNLEWVKKYPDKEQLEKYLENVDYSQASVNSE